MEQPIDRVGGGVTPVGENERAVGDDDDRSFKPFGDALAGPARASERVELHAQVTLTSRSQFLAATTENVSQGGVFVATDEVLPIGTVVRLRISMPDGVSLNAKAVVRRCADANEPHGPGIGLQFTDLSDDDAHEIALFAKERSPMFWEEAPPPEKGRRSSQLPRQVAVTFLPTIRARAQRLARRLPSHVLVDDLVAAGFVGLVDAYRNYRPTEGEPFEPYAYARIQGAMLDELRSADPLSRPLRAVSREIRSASKRLETRLGRPPDDSELAKELDWPLETLRSRAALVACGSAMTYTHDVHDESLEIADPQLPDVIRHLTHKKVHGAVQTALEALPERLRQILEMRYGEELTLRDIGGVLGVTESRVWQLHAEAIELLRATSKVKLSSLPPPT